MKKALYLVLTLSLILPLGLLAATGNIKGTIIDVANGNALAGANITVAGTTQGAASDMSGEYEITGLPAVSAVLAELSGAANPTGGGISPERPKATSRSPISRSRKAK